MKAKQQLRKPENWQDFESLCKKLWGAIWKCPEIKKNGRQGQTQHGVDVYGIPLGEQQYFGIQCKGKDEYTHAQLTESEVDKEIEKALLFEPLLKKFYFATTANKDATIETYIRKKNIESLQKNAFEVHLFSWEDIVDLIDENRETHDYYVKSLNYKTEHDIQFLFENDGVVLSVEVPFRKKITRYRKRLDVKVNNIPYEDRIIPGMEHLSIWNSIKPMSLYTYNHSYCTFRLKLKNIGTEPLKEFKIFLEFEGNLEYIDTTKSNSGASLLGISMPKTYNTYISKDGKTGKIAPLRNILVQDDSMTFDTIYIKPFHKHIETEITINWKLVSLDYKSEGSLKLNIIPTYKLDTKVIFVDDPSDARVVEEIEDYITDKSDQDDD